MNIACSFFLHVLRAFIMRALEKNSRARASYLGALLCIMRAVAFCARAFVKFKSSGTVSISALLRTTVEGAEIDTANIDSLIQLNSPT